LIEDHRPAGRFIKQDESRFLQFNERKARAAEAHSHALREAETAARHRYAENGIVLRRPVMLYPLP
jgi:hypothetical protein